MSAMAGGPELLTWGERVVGTGRDLLPLLENSSGGLVVNQTVALVPTVCGWRMAIVTLALICLVALLKYFSSVKESEPLILKLNILHKLCSFTLPYHLNHTK